MRESRDDGPFDGRLDVSVRAVLDDLATLRDQVAAFLDDHRVEEQRLHEVRLVVSELASNVVRHSASERIDLTIAAEPDRFVLEMSGGPRPEDLPGAPPPRSQWNGRGLVIAQGVADELEVVERDGARTVRCSFHRDGV